MLYKLYTLNKSIINYKKYKRRGKGEGGRGGGGVGEVGMDILVERDYGESIIST